MDSSSWSNLLFVWAWRRQWLRRLATVATSRHPFPPGRLPAAAGPCLPQVYAATTAGSLVLWELTTGVALHTVSVPIGVSSFVVAKGRAFLACSWRSGEAGRVLAYDLASGKPHEERGKVSAPRQLVVSTAAAAGSLLLCSAALRMRALGRWPGS